MANDYELWLNRTHKTTDEERAEIERGWHSNDSESSGGGYYSGYMGDEQPVVNTEQAQAEPVAMQAESQEALSTVPWLADPINFTTIEDKYKADPDYVDEHWSREQIEALGAEFAYQNRGKTRDQWEPLKSDSEFVTKVMQNSSNPWYDPIIDQQQQQAKNKQAIEEYYTPQNETEAAFLADREVKDWDNLKWWQKGLYAFFPGQSDEDLGGAPDWTQKTRDAATAIQSAAAGSAALEILGTGAGMVGLGGAAAVLTNPITLVAAAVGMGGLLYYQARSGKELPVVNKVAELTDLPDTITEHVIGSAIQTGSIGKKYIDQANANSSDAYTLVNAINDTVKDVIKSRKDIWSTSEYTYEMYGGIGDIIADAANVLFEGEGGTKLGEAWMFNKGESEKVQLAEGTYGAEGLKTIRGLYANMRAAGLSDELINSLIQAGVINSAGFSGVMADNLAQSIIDLSALAPGFENSAAKALSEVTHHDIGVEAAQIGKASNALSDVPIIGAIYNGLTGNKSSAGINEWRENYSNIAQTRDVNTLDAFDRFMAGIDDNGQIKRLTPTERQGLFDWLPETKVLGADNKAMNFINSQMADAETAEDVQAVINNYVSTDHEEGSIYNSADVISTRDAVTAGAEKTKVYFQRYKDGEQGRAYLKIVADSLGMEQKDVIDMAESKPEVLTKRMQDIADKNNGKVGTIDAVSIDNVVKKLQAFSGKDALPWNLDILKVQVTASLFDGMNEFNIQKYGVKPDSSLMGKVTEMADTMKSAQSLMLLGLSPSYLINNVINNTVTTIAEGVFGLMSPKQMEDMFDSFGMKPARLGETLSEFRGMDGTISSLDAMNQRLSEAKRTEGLLSDVRSAIRKVNSKAGVFSNISGKFEELQGKQVTATAINQYWRQTWKAGVGFQAMPDVLVEAIEAQSPGMTNMIYLAVERGMSMKDITKSLYGNYIHADVSKTLKDLVADQFPGDPKLFDELFVKSGLLNEIEAAYSLCNTEQERAAALENIRKRTREFINGLKRNEIIDKAESIKNMVDAEGINVAQNLMGDMAILRAETWLQTRDEWGEGYRQVVEDGANRQETFSAINAKQRADWERQHAYEMQVLKGIMDGLGFETQTNVDYINLLVQVNDSWQEFYNKKEQMVKDTYARIQERIDKMTSKEVEMGAMGIVRNDEWNRFYDETEALYQEYFTKERDLQQQMDDVFVKGFEKATGKSGEQIAQNLAAIRDIRQQMATMQHDAHEQTRNMTAKDQAKFYADFDPKYNALIVDIERLQKATGTLIDAEEGQGYEDHDPVKMSLDQTVKAQNVVDEANTERERKIREKIGYMSKEEIKQGWINAGRTESEVELMMAVMEAYVEARTDARTEDDAAPYYAPIFAMKAIIDFEEDTKAFRTMTDEQAVEKNKPIAQALMNDPKKYAAMKAAIDARKNGVETAVHLDGTPKILYHAGGTFSKFNDSHGGSNTGKADSVASNKMPGPMYLTESWNAARSYRKNDSGLIWSRAKQIDTDPKIKAELFKDLNKNTLKTDSYIDWNAITPEQAHDIAYDLRNVVTIADAQERINRGPEDFVNAGITKEEHEKYKTLINNALVLAEAATRENDPIILNPQQAETVATANVMVKAIVGGTAGKDDWNIKLFDDIEKQFRDYKDVSTDAGGLNQSGTIHQVMLAASNPLTVDYNSEEHIHFMMKNEFMIDEFGNKVPMSREYAEAHKNNWDGAWQKYNNEKAWANGNDSVNYLNVIDFDEGSLGNKAGVPISTWVVFDKHLVKNIEGNFDLTNKNFLAQPAADIYTRKGDFAHYDWGNVISMFKSSDISTMVHETGHLFRYALDDRGDNSLLEQFTTWAGFGSKEEFRYLEYQFWTDAEGFKQRDPENYKRYVDAEEKFARGFEQYLIDGSAPTRGLKRVFKEFSRFLLSIYKNIKDLTVNGEPVDINTEIHGVKLRTIFDQMLAGNEIINHYQEAIDQQVSDKSMTRKRMSTEAQRRRAQMEINQRVLSKWKSLDEAEAFLNQMKQPVEIMGLKVDELFLDDVIDSAKSDPKLNPFSDTERHTLTGTLTYGYSQIDPNKKYQFQHKIVELDDLIPSNTLMGNDFPINEEYPAELQPRARDTQQSRNQIYNIAVNMNPGRIIDDMKSISTGAPTIGEGNMYVEAGNGRVLALQQARRDYPESWNNYQEYLRSMAEYIGIDPAELDSFENPVLVRERLGGNPLDLIVDANSRDTLDYSASEKALNDAGNINMVSLGNLDIQPGEGIDTFTTEKNAGIMAEWVRGIPENERAGLMTDNKKGNMILTLDGKDRYINAIFAALYSTPDNLEIIKSISETNDSNIQALESAMKATLPEMSRAEALIRTGNRNPEYSITNDVVVAASLLQEARKLKQNIHDYLAQASIPGMEKWTPAQAKLAAFFGDAKNNVRMLRDFMNVYGEEVFKSGDPNQLTLIPDTRTKDQIIDTAIQAALDNRAKDVMNGVETTPSDTGSTLNQVSSNQTPEYANTLKSNLQKTFDEGMVIPFDKIDNIELKGADDTDYQNLLRIEVDSISRAQGYTDAQSEYAARYLDWRMKDGQGDEPHAATPLIENRVRRDIDEVIAQGTGAVELLQEMKRPGAEPEPAEIPSEGTYVKQVYRFQYGNYTIAANVYADGEFIGYLPEDLRMMQRTIKTDDGTVYKTLAIDPNDPRGYVYHDVLTDEVRNVVPGQVKDIEGPENPNDFIRPARQGTTPDIMPIGSSYEQLQNKYVNPILDKFGKAYENAESDARTQNFNGLDLETRALIEKWLDNNVKSDMAENKYRATKYADMKKDAAMLNYNERYGFDPILTILSPYQFWYTRSMWQWAKRNIDKPRWNQMYSRMKDLEEENRQEIMPSRLEGKWRIPMPFLPDWMGGGVYTDLNSQLFPFSQFGQSYSSNMNYATLNAKTESILNEQMESGLISYEVMQEALTTKKGSVWENAYAQAEQEVSSDQMRDTLASQFFSPTIFWSWYQKKQNNEDPGHLSSTRTGQALKTLTSGTGLESIGGAIGDAMALPEKALRKLYGMDYTEFGSYGDQQIRKQISQMAAEHEISWQDALIAMVEKSGTIWDMAADRQRKENEMKVPLFLGAEAVKSFTQGEANFGDVISAMFTGLLSGQIFPTGERTLREKKASKDQMYIDVANGDIEAKSRWYDENPEYLTRQATYISDPEELLKFTLYNFITDIYYSQPYAQQQEIKNQLGPEFSRAILNSETRNYKAVPVPKLAEWNAAIGGTSPNVGSIDVKGIERVMQLNEQVIDAVDEYYAERDQRFPGAGTIENGYYALPKEGSQRKEYLTYFPQLKEYWDWKSSYKEAHPEFVIWNDDRSDYFNEEMCYNSYADMSESTAQALEYAKATGNDLSNTARYELMKLYQKYADPNFTTLDQYIKALQDYE